MDTFDRPYDQFMHLQQKRATIVEPLERLAVENYLEFFDRSLRIIEDCPFVPSPTIGLIKKNLLKVFDSIREVGKDMEHEKIVLHIQANLGKLFSHMISYKDPDIP